MIPVFMIFQINRRKQKPHLRDCEFIAVSVDKIDKCDVDVVLLLV